jgi:hypothetical protein
MRQSAETTRLSVARPCPRLRRRGGGFTLAEVALTTVIVGTGILGLVELMAVCTRNNREASDSTTAMYLANNLQEAVAHLPFADPSGSATFGLEEAGQPAAVWDDVDDFNGFVASPPLDAALYPIPALANFRQEVTVQRVDPQRLTLVAAGTDAARVTVRVVYRNRDGSDTELHRLTWVRMRG